MPRDDSRADRVSCRRIISMIPPRRATSDPGDRADAALNSIVPEDPMQPYDIKDVIHAIVDDKRFLRGARAFREKSSSLASRASLAARRHRRQSARVSRRRAGHQRVGEGRAIRPFLRRIQYSADHLRGRARVSCPARSRNLAASSSTARNCFSRSPKPPSRKSR